MNNTYSARIIIDVNEFSAENSDVAEKTIDEFITLLAKLSEEHSNEIAWDSVDFSVVLENDAHEA
jgi:hypothetical protein